MEQSHCLQILSIMGGAGIRGIRSIKVWLGGEKSLITALQWKIMRHGEMLVKKLVTSLKVKHTYQFLQILSIMGGHEGLKVSDQLKGVRRGGMDNHYFEVNK